MTEMKAVRLHEFGSPSVLHYEDAPRPEPDQGEILIRVKAIGLNPPDWYLRDGLKALPPEWRPEPSFPIILGSDVSGSVAALGDGVDGFRVGDEIYSMMRFPEWGLAGCRAYAEYATVPAWQAAAKPASLDHVHAGAAPMSLLTAWQFLVDVGHDEPNPLQSYPHVPVPLDGRTVLVSGAGGGVGHFAVQIAKWRGARVIAVASGKNEALMRELGADEFIDYRKVVPEDVVSDVDLVVDCVGGAASSRFLKTLKRGGALFPVFSLGFDAYDEAERLGVTVSSVQVHSDGRQLATIAPLLDDGTIRVVIDSVFPLAEAARSHERAEQGSIQGKIALVVD